MKNKGFRIADLEGEVALRTFEVSPEEEGLRLDRFLAKRLHWMSRSSVQKLVERPLKPSTRVVAGDRIEVKIPQVHKDREEAERDPPLKPGDILYEDQAIVVVNKPAGVPVHPVGMNLHRTVLTALHQRFRSDSVTPQLVHRLDLETSGVLLVARTESALADLTAQFRKREVSKEYRAVVYGQMKDDEGEIDLPLGPDEDSTVPYKQTVRADGRKAVTRYSVLKRTERLSWVRLVPLTGRKHQLRVHLAAFGHPIVGDKSYGPDEKYYFKAREGPPDATDLDVLLLPRQALHAFCLTVRHPTSRETVRFEAPEPAEFDSIR